MNSKFPRTKIFDTLIPFIMIGMAVALFLALLFLFSYVLIWGLILGGILWLIATIKQYLFPPAKTETEIITTKQEGRIIDHDSKE